MQTHRKSTTPYGELIVKILMVFAEFERQSIIRRVTDAYNARSEMGFYMGGPIPYGFNLTPVTIGTVKTKKFVPIQKEIEHIKYIFEMYAQENMILRKLNSNLVANNIQAKRGVGWSSAKISAIVRNPIYVKAYADIYDYFNKHGTQMINDINEYSGARGA